jgi:hypothetical protein
MRIPRKDERWLKNTRFGQTMEQLGKPITVRVFDLCFAASWSSIDLPYCCRPNIDVLFDLDFAGSGRGNDTGSDGGDALRSSDQGIGLKLMLYLNCSNTCIRLVRACFADKAVQGHLRENAG